MRLTVKSLTAILIASGAVFLAALSLPLILRIALARTLGISIGARDAASIGMIGGSDGPTAIFLSGNGTQWLPAIRYGLLGISGISAVFSAFSLFRMLKEQRRNGQ